MPWLLFCLLLVAMDTLWYSAQADNKLQVYASLAVVLLGNLVLWGFWPR